jgi:2-oxoglutarate ferredoxin oxidoreductase subunit beta
VSSLEGSLEDPVNPLLYVLGYGGRFVAQGTPADLNGLTELIVAGLRYPGFAFINVQSPCVTYGRVDAQLKVHKATMKPLAPLGHDSADRLRAMELAGEYGRTLYTGVLYCDPDPPPTYETLVAERQRAMAEASASRERILEMFVPR